MGYGSSYFIDGKQVPQRNGANYNNLTEFDWTLGFCRTTENKDLARIESDGAHFIGGSSLVINAAKDASEPTLVKL